MDDADLLEHLVRIPSPTGSEDKAVAWLTDQARRDGFRIIPDPVGNFHVEAGKGSNLLLFVGHIDTVPGHIPVRREGPVLWGRGSVDAKGPLAACYAAARRHLDDPSIRIRVVGAVDEEGRSRGAKAVPTDLRPSWILIGEPSGANGLTLGYKGILRGAFHLQRTRQHGAHPGPSAVEQALAFWETVRTRYSFEDHFDTVQGRLDALNTSSDGLVDRVEGRFNLRLPPDVDPDRLEAEIRDLAAGIDLVMEFDERMKGVLASKRNSLVAAFLSAIRDRGAEPALKRKTGTSDFSIFAERHPGVPIAAYGPGDASLDHTPHERIDLAEFDAGVSVLDDVMGRLGTLKEPATAASAKP